MNERAKQLALQALKHPDNDNDGLTVFDNDELKKFVELIVGECADYVQFYYKDHMCEVVAHDMKTHFGVEG
jgi:hypothetical protein